MDDSQPKLCSACLLGIKCRYDGRSKPHQKVLALAERETLIPVCPEQLGGLPTPRPAQELQGCSGEDVLEGRGEVKNVRGEDVTENFIQGAQETLHLARIFGVKEAILKQESPSCGCGRTYDGSFSGRTISGKGVTAALLEKEGITIITEEDL